ncbi:damage-inducible protein DinB [Paenibacillus sp. HJL G12]|uniref:Damage-inducible protein DinB n=1 Tax=Paenibacillus dendrobii TaxID=2691084 RepID=A0A7X3IG26_9BACL|nr:DinB family protein [Paenibacillus dendrobii]MWV43272.1 damage-inducible protein DinB [Paenibacillus dendrobii]
MKSWFEYNWQVRDQWFDEYRLLATEELVKERTGGVGTILRTFFHIVDVELSWIRAIDGLEDWEPRFEDYPTLDSVKDLSDACRKQVTDILSKADADKVYTEVQVSWHPEPLIYGEVLRHVIAHEIHHIGQLSIWAKELGIQQVSANYIDRGLGRQMLQEKTRLRIF